MTYVKGGILLCFAEISMIDQLKHPLFEESKLKLIEIMVIMFLYLTVSKLKLIFRIL